MPQKPLTYQGTISGASFKPGEEGETKLSLSFTCSIRTDDQFKSLYSVGRLTGQVVQLQITGDQMEMDFDEE